MDFNRLTSKAKQLFQQRGGTEGVKSDAQDLKDIAQGDGSLTDKAKQAADALREPGDGGSGGTQGGQHGSGTGEGDQSGRRPTDQDPGGAKPPPAGAKRQQAQGDRG